MRRYIDADLLKEFITAHDYLLSDKINSTDKGMFTCGILQAIDKQPTADVRENTRGEWVLNHRSQLWECTNCHEEEIRTTDFCPWCGDKKRTKDEV